MQRVHKSRPRISCTTGLVGTSGLGLKIAGDVSELQNDYGIRCINCCCGRVAPRVAACCLEGTLAMLSKLASISAWRCASCCSMPAVTEIIISGGLTGRCLPIALLVASDFLEVVSMSPEQCR